MGNYFSNEVAVQKKNEEVSLKNEETDVNLSASTSVPMLNETTTENIPSTPNNTEVDPKRSLSAIPEEIVEEIKEYFKDISGVTGVIEEHAANVENIATDVNTAINDAEKVIDDVNNAVELLKNSTEKDTTEKDTTEQEEQENNKQHQSSQQVKKNKKKKHKTH